MTVSTLPFASMEKDVWEVIVREYAITLETARRISKQLSLK